MLKFSILIVCLSVVSSIANDLARGFNDDIEWYAFQEGVDRANTENMPAMVLLHKSWCGACKALKPRFATDKSIEQLSKKFVMINIQDDEEPSDSQFSPDGAYIPRIFFLTPDGKVIKEIFNENGNKQYKYFYSSPEQITKAMQKALDHQAKEEL